MSACMYIQLYITLTAAYIDREFDSLLIFLFSFYRVVTSHAQYVMLVAIESFYMEVVYVHFGLVMFCLCSSSVFWV